MPQRLYIPPDVLIDNPDLTLHEIRSVVNIIIKSQDTILRKSGIFKFRIPKIGVIRSHGRKKPKSYRKTKKKDVIRKRKQAQLKELTKESLLW